MANTYTDNPQPNHVLSVDQVSMRANFVYLANTLGTSLKKGDHQISLNGVDTTTFEGRHIQVSLLNQSGVPPTVAGIGDGTNAIVYARAGDLWMDSGTLAGPYRLTTVNATLPVAKFGTNTNYLTDPNGALNGGWTFLPGGLIMQYGSITTPKDTSTGTCMFPVTFPTAVFNITTGIGRTPFSSSQQFFYVGVIGLSSFTFSNSTNSNTIYWTAIGN